MLKKYGTWLRALYSEELSPKTKFEKHFVLVCRKEAEPIYDIESIWLNYIHSRQVDTQDSRLKQNKISYSTARSAITRQAATGNNYATAWLDDEGVWKDEANDGYSNRVWTEGPTCKLVKLVRG